MHRPRHSLNRTGAALVAAVLLFAASPAPAEVAPSLDAGLTQLAADIVTKSKAKDRNKIAVLPFPNTDGSCSVLSNFLVDKLINSLFQVPDSGQTIVERSQLEALLDELEMGDKGLLDASTTQKLGSIHGVQALVLGSITPSTNQIEVTARLVATDTGAVFASASTTFPRTSDISEWLRQPVTSGPNCGTKGKRSAASAGGTAGTLAKPANAFSTGEVQAFKSDGIRLEFQSVRSEGQTATIVMAVVNTTVDQIPFALKDPAPLLKDADGNQLAFYEAKGAILCQDRSGYPCPSEQRRNYFPLIPNKPRIVTMRFRGDRPLSGNEFWLEASIQLLVPNSSPVNIEISIPDLTVTP